MTVEVCKLYDGAVSIRLNGSEVALIPAPKQGGEWPLTETYQRRVWVPTEPEGDELEPWRGVLKLLAQAIEQRINNEWKTLTRARVRSVRAGFGPS